MIVELVTLVIMLASGSALLHMLGMRGWGLPFVGFVTGIALYIGVGFVQVVSFLPTSPILTLSLTGGVLGVAWVVNAIRRPASRPTLRFGVLGSATAVVVLCALSAGARWVNLLAWSPDSFRYLMSGSLIAQGQYGAASAILVEKRLVGVPLLHSAGNLDGEWYLPAITPVLAVAVLGTVAWFAWSAMRDTVPTRLLVPAILLGVAIIVSTNRFVFHSFYVNGNLLFGALLLLIVGSCWLLLRGDRASRHPLHAIALCAIPALVVTRAESSLVIVLGVLPALLSDRVTFSFKAAVLAVLGASAVLWQLRVVAAYVGEGLDVPISAIALLIFGVMLGAAIPLLRWSWPVKRSRSLLWGVLAALWLVLGVFAVRDSAILIDSVRATAQNLVQGAGSWGWSAMIIALLAVLAIAFFRFDADRQLSFVLSAFVPLAFLLAYFRDDAYRVGDGDSLNRMVIAFVPLAVLLIIAAAAGGRLRRVREATIVSGPLPSSE